MGLGWKWSKVEHAVTRHGRVTGSSAWCWQGCLRRPSDDRWSQNASAISPNGSQTTNQQLILRAEKSGSRLSAKQTPSPRSLARPSARNPRFHLLLFGRFSTGCHQHFFLVTGDANGLLANTGVFQCLRRSSSSLPQTRVPCRFGI